MKEPIQGLWVGPRLSAMEQLSIRSFLAHGHEYHLFCYEQEPEGTPPHVVVEDASRIISSERIYKFREYYAGFSDLFRWKLLLDRGGWWCDLDVVALRPFEFATEYVFAAQQQGTVGIPTSGIARLPAGAPVAKWMWEFCGSKAQSSYTEMGPDLVGNAVRHFRLQGYVQPARIFCPVDWHRWRDFIAAKPPAIPADALAVQLWGSMWAVNGINRDAAFPPGSLYEQLKRRYAPSHL